MASFTKKHLRHVALYFAIIALVQYLIALTRHCKFTLFRINENTPYLIWSGLLLLSILNFIVLAMRLPRIRLESTGLLLYECFPGPVQLRTPIEALPLVSFRVVTRGDYPELIRKNTKLNKETCAVVGLERYLIEIVTEKDIDGIDGNKRVKQIVVPSTYKTKRGTLFKGRNLQYCLEDGVSSLSDEDWIVHLDEDSVMTPDAVRGIANFIADGTCQLGQGCIQYDKDNLTSIPTKVLMAHRPTNDYTLQRVSTLTNRWSKVFMKGSFVACQNRVEKDVSFDGGLHSSLVEFIYFATVADRKGYTFGWIEGHFEELGALYVGDFISQYTRIYYGIGLMRKCPNLESGKKSRLGKFLALCQVLCFVIAMPVTFINVFFRLPLLPYVFDISAGIILAHDVYLYVFSALKMKNSGKWQWPFMAIAFVLFGSISLSVVFTISVIRAIWFRKGVNFEVTKKKD